MVGILNELETFGGKILRQELDLGITVVPNPVNPDKVSVFELFQSTVKVEPYLEDGVLWFQLEAKLIGSLAENQFAKQKTLDTKFLTALDEALTEEITRQTRTSYARLQETKTDVVGLGSLVHKKYPKYWRGVKDRWDEEVFPVVPLKEVKIKVIIRNTAMTL
jgi:spore germination protein KC